jgi:4-hydroxymandelate oxidase
VGSSAVAAHTDSLFDPGLTWPDLGWLREQTSLPLLVKGVLHPLDATRCVEAGADGIIVSNHGGRQLDGAVASITALPSITEAVGGRGQVILDGGVRSGLDVVKAVAQGADGVLLGRPVLWGLAVNGREGVTSVLSMLAEELDTAMALTGCADLGALRNLTVSTIDQCVGCRTVAEGEGR